MNKCQKGKEPLLWILTMCSKIFPQLILSEREREERREQRAERKNSHTVQKATYEFSDKFSKTSERHKGQFEIAHLWPNL